MKQTWSIIIPCLNEEKTIGCVVSNTICVLEKIAQRYEIIIVNDGGIDRSSDIVNEISKTNKNIKLIENVKNVGIAKSLKMSYKIVKYENICAIPADNQFDVNELLPFKIIKENSVVCFYRKNKNQYSFFRKVISNIHNSIDKYLFGLKIKDIGWTKIYKKKHLLSISIVTESLLFQTEICYKLKLKGLKFIEIESTYYDRRFGEEKGANYLNLTMAIKEIITLFFVLLSFRFKKYL